MCVEFGLVIARAKHSPNPSLRRGAVEAAITMRFQYPQANGGILIHCTGTELTELRFGVLSAVRNLTIVGKLTPLHHIRNSNPSLN